MRLIAAEDERIKQANTRVRTYQQRVDAINKDVEAVEKKQADALNNIKKFEEGVKTSVDTIVAADTKLQEEEAARNASRLGTGKGMTAEMAREQVRKQTKEKKEGGNIIASLQKQLKAQEGIGSASTTEKPKES